MRLLTAEQQCRYQRDGIAFPINVLSAAEANLFRCACDQLEAQLGGKPRTVEVRQMHLHLPWAWQLAAHPRVLDAVEDLLGPNLLIWATELFAKHPHDSGVSIGWHRDRPYMGFKSNATVTAWIALSDSAPENGCMRVVYDPDRRSASRSGANGESAHGTTESRSRGVPEGEVADVVLLAGQMSLHDADIWHGSGPNLSDKKRVGFAVRFITPEAQPLADRPPAVLVRGGDRSQRFQLLPPPEEKNEKNADHALAEMKRSAARHLDSMLQNLRQAN